MNRKWLLIPASVAVVAAATAATACAQQAQPQPQPGMAPRGGGPGMRQELKLVDRFDADSSGWLKAAERAAAAQWLETSGVARGPGGRGPGMAPGARGGAPGTARGGPPAGVNGTRPEGMPPRGGMGPGGMPGAGGPGVRPRMVASAPGEKIAPSEVKVFTGEPLYDVATLRTIFIDFESNEWERELALFHNTDVEVPARVRVDGAVYDGVGVSFRGASSFMMVPAGSKRSFNLSFDLVDDDQRIGSYRTLNLLNANGDPTFVRTALYAHIAQQYVATPRVNFVRVVVNGENWGIYSNAQQFNTDFTRDYFRSTAGARWKVSGSPNGRGGMSYLGDDASAYRSIYEIRSKDAPESWAALIELFRVLEQTPVEQLEAALAPLLDVDGALRFLALDVALVNSDGFWTRASDYNLYRDGTGRFHVLPHDMNEALGGNARLDPLVGSDDASKPLRSRLLAVPALRQRYLGYVREIAQQWLDWNRIGPQVEQYRALIAADVARDTRKLYSTDAFDEGFTALRSFIEQRREYLLSATDGTGTR